MDVKDFAADPQYASSCQAAECLNKLDLNDPTKSALGEDESMASLMQAYVSSTAHSTTKLIELIGSRDCTMNVTVDGDEMTPAQQKVYLEQLASKQNLLSRQLEKSLQTQICSNKGVDTEALEHLINPPPTTWGNETKVSDTSLKLIHGFDGDSADLETSLNEFLRSVYTLAQTADLTEQVAIAVLIRKLSGTAHTLVEQFVISKGGSDKLTLAQLVAHLEKKFLQHCSALSADQQLYNLTQGRLTYSQLQAKIQRLSKLATRLEKPEGREKLTRVKETTAFMMSISNNDRLFLHSENSRRAVHNLPQMNLDMMVDCLIKLSADKVSYREHPAINMASSPVALPSSPIPAASPQVAQVREAAPVRGNFRGNQVPTRGARMPAYPRQGGQPNDRYNMRNANRGARGNFRGANRRQEKPRVWVTHTMANVPANCCLLCGDPSHTFRQQNCPYYGTELMPSACRHCNIGCHAHSRCMGKPPRNWAGPNQNRF